MGFAVVVMATVDSGYGLSRDRRGKKRPEVNVVHLDGGINRVVYTSRVDRHTHTCKLTNATKEAAEKGIGSSETQGPDIKPRKPTGVKGEMSFVK
jgi:hypothetical protein